MADPSNPADLFGKPSENPEEEARQLSETLRRLTAESKRIRDTPLTRQVGAFAYPREPAKAESDPEPDASRKPPARRRLPILLLSKVAALLLVGGLGGYFLTLPWNNGPNGKSGEPEKSAEVTKPGGLPVVLFGGGSQEERDKLKADLREFRANNLQRKRLSKDEEALIDRVLAGLEKDKLAQHDAWAMFDLVYELRDANVYRGLRTYLSQSKNESSDR